jgi:hypothetical protein
MISLLMMVSAGRFSLWAPCYDKRCCVIAGTWEDYEHVRRRNDILVLHQIIFNGAGGVKIERFRCGWHS